MSLIFAIFSIHLLVTLIVYGRKPNEKDFNELNDALECGFVSTRNDPDFDSYRNSSVPTFDEENIPLIVVVSECEKDVVITIKWYQKFRESTTFRMRSGGHGFGGYSSSYGAILIDLSRLKSVEILNDVQISIEPGVKQEEYEDWKLLPENINFRGTIPHGVCGDVCIGGLLQGGGIGLTTPQWASATHHIFGVNVILCDGSLWRIIEDDCDRSHCIDGCDKNKKNNELNLKCPHLQNLLFAIKGSGGGNFGIITKYYLNTIREPKNIKFFALLFPLIDREGIENSFRAYKNVVTDPKFIKQDTNYGFLLQIGFRANNQNNDFPFDHALAFQCIYFPDNNPDIFKNIIHTLENTMQIPFVSSAGNITTGGVGLSTIYKTGVFPRWSKKKLEHEGLFDYPLFSTSRLIGTKDFLSEGFIKFISNQIYNDIVRPSSEIISQGVLPLFLLEKMGGVLSSKNMKTSFPVQNRNAWSDLQGIFVYLPQPHNSRHNAMMTRDIYTDIFSSHFGDKKYINYMDDSDTSNDLTKYYTHSEIEKLQKIKQVIDPHKCFRFELGIDGGFIPPKPKSYRSSGCDTKIKMKPGDTKDFTMTVDGFKREYILHLPINYDDSDEYGAPTALFLHGHRMLKELMASDFMRIIPQSDMFGYIAIIPEGIPAAIEEACSLKDRGYDNEDKCTVWNDLSASASPGPKGPICAPDNVPFPRPDECADIDGNKCNYLNCNVDDEKFIHLLMDDIESKYCVDISREYVTGYSIGGMMSHLLACTSTYRWAAVATLHGTRHRGFNCFPNNVKYDFSNDCYDWRTERIPKRRLRDNKHMHMSHMSSDDYGNMYSMPLMNICGTRDVAVPCYSELAEGQESGYGSGWYYIPVNEVSKDFAIANECKDYALNPFNNRIRTKSDDNDWKWKCYGYSDKCKDDAWSIFCQYDAAHESLFVELYFGISTDNFVLREVWNFWKKYKRIPQCIARKKKCLNDDECCSRKCKNAYGKHKRCM